MTYMRGGGGVRRLDTLGIEHVFILCICALLIGHTYCQLIPAVTRYTLI